MPCNNNCNQNRNCDCDRKMDKDIMVVATLLFICIVSMGFGVYLLLYGNKGQDCAITVQFNGSKATYLGKVV